MLRYLGVPARVAVGFSSGTYDAEARRVARDRSRRARLGRGVVPRLRLAAVRSDAGRPARARAAERAVRGGRRGPRYGSRGRRPASGTGPTNGRQAAHRHGETPGTGVRTFGRSTGGGSQRHTAACCCCSRCCSAVPSPRSLSRSSRCGASAISRATRAASRPRAARSSPTTSSTSTSTPRAARRCTSSARSSGTSSRSSRMRFVAAATAARFGPPDGAAPRGPRRPARAAGAHARDARAVCARATALRGIVSLRSLGLRVLMHAVVMAAGEGTPPAAAHRALAEAGPADRRPARDRDAPARARGAGCERVVRRHRPSRRAGRGARRRRLRLRARRLVRAPARRARLGRHGAARARGGRRAAAPRQRAPTRSSPPATCGGSSRPRRGCGRRRSPIALEPAAGPAAPVAGASRRRPRRARARRRPREPEGRRAALGARRRARPVPRRRCRGRRSSSPVRFSAGSTQGSRIAGIEIGKTRDLTHPLDLVKENFRYLGS